MLRASGDGSEVVVTAPAEVDHFTSGQFAQLIAQACALKPARVVVDFSQTTFCDTAALEVLWSAAVRLRHNGCRLEVRSPGRVLMLMAQVLGLSTDLGLPSLPVR